MQMDTQPSLPTADDGGPALAKAIAHPPDGVISAHGVMPSSSKTLKRCLSVPILRTLPSATQSAMATGGAGGSSIRTRSAAAAAAVALANRNAATGNGVVKGIQETTTTPTKEQNLTAAIMSSSGQESNSNGSSNGSGNGFGLNIHIGIPRSNPSSREVSPAPMFNIFAPRARRYSASYSPLGAASGNAAAPGTSPLCLTPRVSQLRQEECVEAVNTREANHEREMHSAMQMSQSWEDLTLVAENWSCKSDELSNPLQVALPAAGVTSCSSPSPTNTRAGLRLPYGLSPSPTRRTFATRRSMSPSAMRPSQLGPVKRKFELDENNSGSNWNVYSPPPLKKIFTDSRGSSPVCQSPSSLCPSPDSGTYDGRITPKLFISKLCTSNNNNNNNNSACSSPSSNSVIDSTITSGICSSASSSTGSVSGSNSEPMCIGSNNNCTDEGISITENYDKLHCSSSSSSSTTTTNRTANSIQPMTTDLQDDATLMDDMKSETSSIGGCSSISIESSSCDSATKSAASFLNRLNVDDISSIASPLGQKNFFINKQGLSGAKKYIVNHDNLPNNNNGGGGNGDQLQQESGTRGRRNVEEEVEGSDALMRVMDENKTDLLVNEQQM